MKNYGFKIFSICLGIVLLTLAVLLLLALSFPLLGFEVQSAFLQKLFVLFEFYGFSSFAIPLIILFYAIVLIVPEWNLHLKFLSAITPLYFFTFVFCERLAFFLCVKFALYKISGIINGSCFVLSLLMIALEMALAIFFAEKFNVEKPIAREYKPQVDIVGTGYTEHEKKADDASDDFRIFHDAEPEMQTAPVSRPSETPNTDAENAHDDSSFETIRADDKTQVENNAARPAENTVVPVETFSYETDFSSDAIFSSDTENTEAQTKQSNKAGAVPTEISVKKAAPLNSGYNKTEQEAVPPSSLLDSMLVLSDEKSNENGINETIQTSAPNLSDQADDNAPLPKNKSDETLHRETNADVLTPYPEALEPHLENDAIDTDIYFDENDENGAEETKSNEYDDAAVTRERLGTKSEVPDEYEKIDEHEISGDIDNTQNDENSYDDTVYGEAEDSGERKETNEEARYDGEISSGTLAISSDDESSDEASDAYIGETAEPDADDFSFERTEQVSQGKDFGSSVSLTEENNGSAELSSGNDLKDKKEDIAVAGKPHALKYKYEVPSDLLTVYPDNEYWIVDDASRKAARILKETLREFKINVEVKGITKGPVVTMFELMPPPGIKLSKITSLQDNIALRLAAPSVRIVAPIPGKEAVGIEVPNETRAIVSMRELIEADIPQVSKMAIPVLLGKDITGRPQTMDIAQTPHLLIAGATGSGKSVCVNSIIISILYNRTPEQVRLILVDPKIVELKLYNGIAHLLAPVITEPKKAFQALQYCLCEMERRYALLDSLSVRDIKAYNAKVKREKLATETIPYIVIIIDEFADLMVTTGKELESTVARLCAMSRAVGIHLVLATQRPSINVITGLIKANIPTRIAFMVASNADSRIILDESGAEKLLGKGDMLYVSITNPFPVRIQGSFVSDTDVEKVVEHVKTLREPDYIEDEMFIDEDEQTDSVFIGDSDPLYDKALEIVLLEGKASASYLQRRLKIGYNRAARIVEEMYDKGIVGPANGSKPREVIYNP